MSLPQFFFEGDLVKNATVWLDEDNARHVVQVLRMVKGEQLQLTNGKGYSAICAIAAAEKKKCSVQIIDVVFHEQRKYGLHLCVAFTKNTSRNEWLLEKATELGVRSITPLITTRTERERIRYDRWHNILVAALLQSQQFHLPLLNEATTLEKLLQQYKDVPQKFIAHCIEGQSKKELSEMLISGSDALILIGPEGDFTSDEVNLCVAQGCNTISLGTQRLRTETAAVAVCAYFNFINHD